MQESSIMGAKEGDSRTQVHISDDTRSDDGVKQGALNSNIVLLIV